MDKLCSVCKHGVDGENAAILTIGGFGNPRYLCEECERDIEDATRGRELDSIYSAMDRLGTKVSANAMNDALTFETVEQILSDAKSRAQLIRDGEYDFSLDEEAEDEEDADIPEELRETEEDRKLDEEDAEKAEKAKALDKWFNLIYILVILGVVAGFLIYKFAL